MIRERESVGFPYRNQFTCQDSIRLEHFFNTNVSLTLMRQFIRPLKKFKAYALCKRESCEGGGRFAAPLNVPAVKGEKCRADKKEHPACRLGYQITWPHKVGLALFQRG